jgi:hypothetical protein
MRHGSRWQGAVFATGAVLWLGSACGGQSARRFAGGGESGAGGPGSGAYGGVNANGTGGEDFGGGDAGAAMFAGTGGGGATPPTAGGSSAGGTTAGDGSFEAGAGGVVGEAGAGSGPVAGGAGRLECDDCSLLDATCFVGVCDTELGRCSRHPVAACRSGDDCCPTGCVQDEDAECTSFRVVLAPAYSGNRREDGALGVMAFAGAEDGQRSHAFFAFDLAGVEGTITSAELDLHYEAYLSPDPAEHFVVYSAATTIEALIDPALRPDVYDALQAGSYQFDTAMTVEHVSSSVTFGLNTTSLNASLGSYASLGIVADSSVGDSSAVEGVRFSDGVDEPLERLSLVVEP